ncbi:MAG TPA: BatD family protein [Rhodanobacteraceae bacterium]|nr:BatD family protein [Rhodanobacteraceae bacterium]
MNARLLRIAGLLGFVALWICESAAAAPEARAWLDRNSMHIGETVTLNVEVSGDTGAKQPDFSVLQNDFEMLGTQSQTSMSVVNGESNSKLLWAVGLQPRRAGTLTIPAFAIGNVKTQAISLNVLPAQAGAVGKAGDDVFVDAEATPRSPYVQQEVRLTVKLFYALNLTDGNLDDPKVEGLVVRKLGQDSNYTAEVDHRRYRVVERHYAISAENSGALEIPAIAFRGHAFGPGDMNSFFSRGQGIAAQSEPITLDVRARPPESGSDVWLPAQSLTLSAEGVDASSSVHVGEPLTLTLRLKAQGLGFEQLPELKLPKIDGADIYPDKETTQNRDDGSWQYGTRERKFAIVPSRPGTLQIPQISIAWWDSAHDRAAISEVPALSIPVAPAQATGAPEPARPVAPSPSGEAPPSAAPALAPITATSDLELRQWRLLAFAAIALWIVSAAAALAWLLSRRRAQRRASRQQDQPAALISGGNEFRAACTRGDLPAAARALLTWARRERPALRNLGELARAVSDAKQAAVLGELERALYASASAPVDAAFATRFAQAFRSGFAFAAIRGQRADEPVLAELYPFKI